MTTKPPMNVEGYVIGPLADLSGADLSGADLSEADLRGADLSGADLYAANLRGAGLTRARGAICLGTDPRGYRFVGVRHSTTWMVAAGCRWFTLAQARQHWRGNPDALARLSILDAAIALETETTRAAS